MPNRYFALLSLLPGLVLQAACMEAPETITANFKDARIVSAMRPISRNCGAATFEDETSSAADPATKANLYWLAECDAVRVRWSEHSFPESSPSQRIDLCNPTTSLPFSPPVTLIEYRAAMLATGSAVATYASGHAGCEPQPDSTPPPLPEDFHPTADALLQLFSTSAIDIASEILTQGNADSDATLLIAKIGADPRTLQPRILTALGCEASDDGTDPCDKRKYTWRAADDDDEVFSERLRITKIEVLRGRETGGSADGVEGLALSSRTGFECDRDTAGRCIALPFEWVQAAAAPYRCSNVSGSGMRLALDIRADCANPSAFFPLDATPVAILESGISNNNTPLWTVNFKASTGFPPPVDDTTLAIRFTVVSLDL